MLTGTCCALQLYSSALYILYTITIINYKNKNMAQLILTILIISGR